MSGRISTVKTVGQLRKRVGGWRAAGETVALVPTMGALHEGHLSLVRLAKRRAARAAVSIFVNPTQFAPNEDFAAYPRDTARDRKLLAALGTDLVFAPSGDHMYPDGFSTQVEVGDVSEGLCGASRPHHFGGVATVVTKLLLQCLPDIAIFGEKDYQQLMVIKRMVRDLDIPVKVIGGPIVREADGLALSSRNAYLSAAERATAPRFQQTLAECAKRLSVGEDSKAALRRGRAALRRAGFALDYLELRNAQTLAPISGKVSEPARVFGAVILGRTRLIDNVAVPRRR